MGPQSINGVGRRSRLRSYLLLARVSNLPTIWTNVLAGLVLANGGLEWWPLLAVAASAFYTGGMFLNDAFDLEIDRRERPDRPLPRGDVSRAEAFTTGGTLLASGAVLLIRAPRPSAAVAVGVALAAAIVFYNFRHKGVVYGPVVMGLCRALVYLLAAAATTMVSSAVAVGAAAMWLYVIALTSIAKRIGSRASVVVPAMVAAISLVDAAAIATSGAGWMPVACVAAFGVTLALQRSVPGT